MYKKWTTSKLIDYNDVIFISLLLGFRFLNIFSSRLTRSLDYPIASVFINIVYIAIYFAILYFVGFFVVNILHGLAKSKETNNDLEFIDYFLIGIISFTCIGIIGGTLGILNLWYYGIVVILLPLISKRFKIYAYPSIRVSRNWIFFSCIIIFFIIFSIYYLMASLEVYQVQGDVLQQYIHQLRAIITYNSIRPDPFAIEIKISEYYYPYMMSMPVLLPSFIQSLPYINVGMSIFTVLVIFYGI
ncbi:MAG: hypothetical protein HQK93_08720, partial [Nitrospirae bacterium]|nr:hypothetical protein [Nitrospirota bacterium]